MTAPIPLSDPLGVIYGYACGCCRKMRALGERQVDEYNDKIIASMARCSLASAEACCRCCRCNAPFLHVYGEQHCDKCRPIENVEYYARAAENVKIEADRKALRSTSSSKSSDLHSAVILEAIMSEISERDCCHEWLSGLEFDLWRIVHGGRSELGFDSVSEKDIKSLRTFSTYAGGWWRRDEFVPIDEWLKAYAAHEDGGTS